MNLAEVRLRTADSTMTYRLFAKRATGGDWEVKAYLASIPPERRRALAKRALALHLQRGAGRPPSIYLAAALGRTQVTSRPVEACENLPMKAE